MRRLTSSSAEAALEVMVLVTDGAAAVVAVEVTVSGAATDTALLVVSLQVATVVTGSTFEADIVAVVESSSGDFPAAANTQHNTKGVV